MDRRSSRLKIALTFGRAYPLRRGYTTLAHSQLARRAVVGAGLQRARLRTGGWLWVDPADYIGRMVLLFGDYDPKITWVCQQVLRPGDTVLDIGANVGIVSAHAAALVGDGGAVHAFEPQRDFAANLERSMAESGYTAVTVHPVALSDHDGEMPLYGSEEVRAEASLHPRSDGALLGQVTTVATDAYLGALALPRARLLKIDVEGHEGRVLEAAAGYLHRTPPEIIAFESHGDSPFFDRPAVRTLLAHGYRLYRLPAAYSRRIRLEAVTAATRMDPGRYDFLAVGEDAEWPPARLVSRTERGGLAR